ncbi:MAG: class I SAM-dependent methyltransferase [Planctomycetes bacterium]|nr:class I SAM-dependent methyltransferase [Planctomycetota bacterium]
MFRTSCLVCQSSNLTKIIDLGIQPFADTFIPEPRLSESDQVYPLSCDLCNDCGQIQTSCITNPQDRYILQDYSYTSSNSSFSRNHWEDYAKVVVDKTSLEPDSFIVEIGSNDGYLSEQFLKLGHRALGVDPSPYMAELAKKRNIDTVVEVFEPAVASKIHAQYGEAQLIVANNVFNHADAPLEFAKAAADLLSTDGTFIFELPYWISGLETHKFDQIYHEHVSYFTVTSSSRILESVGLQIVDVQLVDYHGGSIRVFAKHKDGAHKVTENVRVMMEEEKSCGAFDPQTYSQYMNHILDQRNKFLSKIYEIKAAGKPIIAVGAAAKGNTFLNFYNLDSTIIDYVTDASPHKQGKYTPLTRIPICGDDKFAEYDEVYALILSWNISDKLKIILNNINPKINFLSLPD